jgi:hypothetical protein
MIVFPWGNYLFVNANSKHYKTDTRGLFQNTVYSEYADRMYCIHIIYLCIIFLIQQFGLVDGFGGRGDILHFSILKSCKTQASYR